ncbi:hypothetical protein [Sedimenticola thiotaurini]|uniref:Uncharacterized protein n=1 Tax=Sedimenticola thiotaurini TaxID=1543721 RepID=A0A0F7JXU6_9GAMM|nr:hypothetical protein [Sedimenticola thiotaurini]AKH20114.1 hypothetical protein AAY24_06810 [Sedimenticola thiotaurini]
MKRPTFLEGVGIALAASLTGSILFSALSPVMPDLPLLKLLIAGLGLAYSLYLFRRSSERLGRLVTAVVWLICAILIGLLDPPLTLYLALHIGLIWLIRSLYFHSSPLSALADLGLSGLGLAAAIWAALHTGSLLLTIWCFFLLQALFSAIPADLKKTTRDNRSSGHSTDRFQQAEQAAEAALCRLTSMHR